MAKQRRFILSGGLAFSEQRDMNKLSRLAAEGWILESFAFLGYYVRRSEPQQLTYAVDYNKVSDSDRADYCDIFEASGWTHVCSEERIHIFSAPIGTKPIYTDTDTKVEKYAHLVSLMKPFLAAPLFTLIMFALYALLQSAGEATLLENILITAGALSLIVSVPILMTFTVAFIRLKRVKS